MKRKVLVIAGATAVGKTSCSIAIAKQFSGEIINGDALQVYRGLNMHGWPHRDLNDEGKKLDKPIGHVGEGLRLAAVVGHLQK